MIIKKIDTRYNRKFELLEIDFIPKFSFNK